MNNNTFYLLTFLLLNISVQGQTSPGGVSSNLSYWLKGDAGISHSSGVKISSWVDQTSGSSNAVTQGDFVKQPLLVSNALNFNPGVFFDGTDDRISTNSSNYSSSTQIIVFNPTKTISSSVFVEIVLAYDLPGSANADAGIGVGHFSGTACPNGFFLSSGDDDTTSPEYIACLNDASFSSDEPFLAVIRENSTGTNAEHRLWGKNMTPLYSNPSEYAVYTNRPFTIGQRHGGSIEYEGDVLEVISYSSRITGTELHKIESYLAIKYGITLDQTVALDYIDSNGNTIYDSDGLLSSYNFNITGIGRDDLSGLNQKQSKSIHSNTMITIGLGTIALDNISNTSVFTANLSYMIWGNNDGSSVINQPVNTISGSLNRMSRIWAMTESGTVGATEISIPQSFFGTGDKYLLVSTDETFDENDTSISLTDDGNGNYIASYDFENGTYFSFGEGNNAVLSVDKNSLVDEKITIYPNPVNNKLTILSKNVNILQTSIYDLYGRKIIDSNEKWNDNLELNISKLSTGTYLINFVTEKENVIKKFIKN